MAFQHDGLVMGIDLGTGGARVIVADPHGRVVAAGQAKVPSLPGHQPDHHEQDPGRWWTATQQAVAQTLGSLHDTGVSPALLQAVSVDGTSGTLVCLDEKLDPVRPALMYNDGRSAPQAADLSLLAGSEIHASFAIAKAHWVKHHEPEVFHRTRWLAHHADCVLWRLTGQAGVTDYSNALKSGYDIVADRWPGWIESLPELRRRLPPVVAPGSLIGTLCPKAAQSLGLAQGLSVISGASDGTAGFLASGACNVGDDNTTLGTTLVFKRLAGRFIADPSGTLYCHRLPGGLWLPGAASNTGGEWLRRFHAAQDLASLDREAQRRLPCPHLAWPLVRKGERFPIRDAAFEGFCEAPQDDAAATYAARLQGTAMVERLCYEALDAVTGPAGGGVYATGGAACSDVFMQLRADVTGRVYHRPACTESAFGAAVLAASAVWFGQPLEAVRAMVRLERSFEPDPTRRQAYDALFEAFCRRMPCLETVSIKA